MTTQSIDSEIKATLDSLFGGKDTTENTSSSSKPTFAELREQGNGLYSLSPRLDPEKDYKGTLYDIVTKNFSIKSFDRYPVPVKLYQIVNGKSASPVVLYTHGGGYFSGDLEYHDSFLSTLSRITGFSVLSYNYRLCPEYRFPVPFKDGVSCLRYLIDNASELGIDQQKILLMGDSAGAGISAGLALYCSVHKIPIRMQYLIYPALNPLTVRAEPGNTRHELLKKVAVWSYESNKLMYEGLFGEDNFERYLAKKDANDLMGEDAIFFPFLKDDLNGFPETVIEIGDLDIFYDDCLDFHRRLKASGVKSELIEFKGYVHAYDNFLSIKTLMKIIERRAQELKRM